MADEGDDTTPSLRRRVVLAAAGGITLGGAALGVQQLLDDDGRTTAPPSTTDSAAGGGTTTATATEAREYQAHDPIYDMDAENVNRATSEHFQIVWGTDAPEKVTDAFIQGNLENLEAVWTVYVDELGFRPPSQSVTQDDPTHYKTNVYVTETGLAEHAEGWAFQGFREGYGNLIVHPDAMRVDPPSWTIAHEFGHVATVHQGGGWNDNSVIGPWWESMAEWLTEQYLYSDDFARGGTQYGPKTGFADPQFTYSHLWPAHGNMYYDSWPLLQYLHENPDNQPGYGEGSIVTLLQETTVKQNIFEMIDGVGSASLKDTLGHYAKRMPTMDFEQQATYRSHLDELLADPVAHSNIVTDLEPAPDRDDWWRVPTEHAPLQAGFNIVELIPESDTVRVEFEGITGSTPAADWRAALVAATKDGTDRYSKLFSSGSASLSVGDANRMYLTVIATPDEHLDVSAFANENEQSFQSDPAKTAFPYEVSVGGGRPKQTTEIPGRPSGSRHPNGGGFVADSASVDRSVFVGERAAVLGSATITDDAQVRDGAVVAGNATVSGQARVIEHGRVVDNGTVRNRGVVKGTARVFGEGVVEGTAVVDGDYTGTLTLDSGTVFGWLPEPSIAKERPAHPETHTEFTFDTASDRHALDTHGVNHGLLRGGPQTTNGGLELNGSDQYVLLPDHLLDYRERGIEIEVEWDGGPANQRAWAFGTANKRLYLTPAGDAGTVTAVVDDGRRTHTIQTSRRLSAGESARIGVTVGPSGGELWVDGTRVGANPDLAVEPVALRTGGSHGNYIGRGVVSAPLFTGRVTAFRIGTPDMVTSN
jgi:hypothetical protein